MRISKRLGNLRSKIFLITNDHFIVLKNNQFCYLSEHQSWHDRSYNYCGVNIKIVKAKFCNTEKSTWSQEVVEKLQLNNLIVRYNVI